MIGELPKDFKYLPLTRRREIICDIFQLAPDELDAISGTAMYMEVTDMMVESAIGVCPVPLGVAKGFIIDGDRYHVPMATEESSVVAAATHGAKLVGKDGFYTWATDPVMTAQLYLEGVDETGERTLNRNFEQIGIWIDRAIPNMKARGGGFRGIEMRRMPESGLLRLHIDIDVRDAMGANALNTAVERVRKDVESISGGKVLMAILSNQASKRLAGAKFQVPVARLARNEMSGEEVARRIELATRVAWEDTSRAVTHNKGILNGITALCLATGNDTRAIEAACHCHASRDGRYRSLSRFEVIGDILKGSLELPLATGTVGGATTVHPASKFSLRLLHAPSASRLARIAAAVGLAQNLTAVQALVCEGIQNGHMSLHASRVAYLAGARGKMIKVVAEKMKTHREWNVATAKRLLDELTPPT